MKDKWTDKEISNYSMMQLQIIPKKILKSKHCCVHYCWFVFNLQDVTQTFREFNDEKRKLLSLALSLHRFL